MSAADAWSESVFFIFLWCHSCGSITYFICFPLYIHVSLSWSCSYISVLIDLWCHQLTVYLVPKSWVVHGPFCGWLEQGWCGDEVPIKDRWRNSRHVLSGVGIQAFVYGITNAHLFPPRPTLHAAHLPLHTTRCTFLCILVPCKIFISACTVCDTSTSCGCQSYKHSYKCYIHISSQCNSLRS